MLARIVAVLVLLNSYPIYSIDDSTHASSDEDIPAILMKDTGMSMFEAILKNLSNQTIFKAPHAKEYSAGKCLSDLMQIQTQLQNMDINALQSKFVRFISAELDINRNKRHSDRCMGQAAVRNVDWKFICVRQFRRMFRGANQKTEHR